MGQKSAFAISLLALCCAVVDVDPNAAMEVAAALAGRRVPVTSGFVGRSANA